MTTHYVRQGDCLASLAKKYSLTPDILWKDPQNESLRNKRENPDVLYPGDTLVAREKEKGEVSGETEKRHRFRCKGTITKLRLRLLEEIDEDIHDEEGDTTVDMSTTPPEDKPRAQADYLIDIHHQTFSGKTNDDGIIEQTIPPNTHQISITVEGDAPVDLLLGHLDPVTHLTGVQARVYALGFPCGKIDGRMGPKTKASIQAFQAKHELTIDGIPGPETQDKLSAVYGC